MGEDGKITTVELNGQSMALPATKQPILYKYFGPPVGETTYSEANLENLIIRNEVRLSSNGEVNDPSDSAPIIAHDHDKKDLEKYFHRLATTPSDDPATERMRKSIAAQTKNRAGRKKFYKEHAEHYARAATDSPDKSFRSSGFTCMTEEWSNRLMWSHYAQSHRGVCIGFRTRPIDGETSIPFAGNFLRVKYISERPIWSLKAMMKGENQAEILKNSLFRKDNVWSYEKEWRFTTYIKNGAGMFKGGDIVSIGPDEIDEVIFGMRASEVTRKKVLEMLSVAKKTPTIYESKFGEKSFELERTLIGTTL